jgi:hypothetical protein
LGVPIADEKSNGPVTNLVFLGLEIDTIEMVIKIPHVGPTQEMLYLS